MIARKNLTMILGAALACLLAGCATAPVLLSPVGPNPFALAGAGPEGQLEVYSALEGRTEGDNPTWFQHTDYYLYTPQRQLLKHVSNNVQYYDEAPRRVTLPAGTYLVKARAKDYFWVEVPVTIRGGQATLLHLDGRWAPPSATPETRLVHTPDGSPVGWRVEQTVQKR